MTDKQTQPKEMTAQQVSFLELAHVLVKRKVLIILICAVTAVASALYSLTLPNVYSATAKVLPPQKDGGSGLSSLLGQGGALAGLALGGIGGGSDLYLGILKSRSVSDAVIKRLELVKVYRAKTFDLARQRLNRAVLLQAGKDGIITITAEDTDPKRSALLANAFVDELGKTTVRLNLTKVGTERIFLEKRLELVRNDLKAAEEDLKAFAQQNKIVQVDSQAGASIAAISKAKADLVSKEVQLSVLLSQQTEQSPEVQALRSGIKRLKSELGALAGNGGGADGIPSIGKVPSVGLDYSRKLRELKTQEAIYEQLTKQYEMAKLGEAKDSSSVQVLDAAVVPESRCKPARTKMVLTSLFIAFFTSIFLVFLLDYLEKLPEDKKALFRQIWKSVLALK